MINTIERLGIEVEVFETLEEFKMYFTYKATKYIFKEASATKIKIVTSFDEDKIWIFKVSGLKYNLINWSELSVKDQNEIWSFCLSDITSEIEKKTNKRPTLKIESASSDEDNNGSSMVIIEDLFYLQKHIANLQLILKNDEEYNLYCEDADLSNTQFSNLLSDLHKADNYEIQLKMLSTYGCKEGRTSEANFTYLFNTKGYVVKQLTVNYNPRTEKFSRGKLISTKYLINPNIYDNIDIHFVSEYNDITDEADINKSLSNIEHSIDARTYLTYSLYHYTNDGREWFDITNFQKNKGTHCGYVTISKRYIRETWRELHRASAEKVIEKGRELVIDAVEDLNSRLFNN